MLSVRAQQAFEKHLNPVTSLNPELIPVHTELVGRLSHLCLALNAT